MWEDADMLCEALKPKAKKGRFLSIGSTGDHVFSLLTLDPLEVVAVDRSLSQLAYLQLRIATYRELNYLTMLSFLGITPSSNREAIYHQIRTELTDAALHFWNSHQKAIAVGLIHSGEMEKKIRFFARHILPWIHRQKTVDALLGLHNLEEQKRFYDKEWNTWLWRAGFKMTFGNESLSHLKTVIESTSIRDNPYLYYLLKGNYSLHTLPRALKEENFNAIRAKISAIHLSNMPIEIADKGSFDGFNLATHFDKLEDSDAQKCYEALLDRANSGARLVWWSRKKRRIHPIAGKSIELTALSKELLSKDKGWMTRSFTIHEVI